MDPRFLAYLELRQDFLFDKIPADKIVDYIDASLSEGAIKADEIKNQDVLELIDAAGIKIEKKEGTGEFFKVKLRAQFEYDPKGKHKIIIYMGSINEFAQQCGLSEDEALRLHLTHEYFHFIEFNDGKTVAERLDPIVNFTLFGLKKKAHINRCSEIAAHSFTMHVLNLEMLPNGYDIQYLINTNKITPAMLASWEEEFNNLPQKKEL